MSLRLISLGCHRCGSSMRGEPTDVLFICDHCGAGAVLDLPVEGDALALSPVDCVGLMPAPGRRAELWRPAWLIEAKVLVEDRRTANGRATPGSVQERTFVIPAFAMPLDDLCALARALSKAQGELCEVPREAITGGVLSLDDAITLVRHLVTGEEVHRPDLLATVSISVEPTRRSLAAIPFERGGAGGTLRCSVTGTRAREGR